MKANDDLGNARFEELMERLTAERSRVDELRANYAKISRSRFHSLRILWFSIKELFGLTRGDDVYAVWSPNLRSAFGVVERPADLNGGGINQLHAPERALVTSWNERARTRSSFDTPLVTLVVPVYNNRAMTVRCLESIAKTWFDSLPVQFVIVDDGSTDATADVVTRLSGVDVVRSGRNEGFVRACNRGAALARGKYVCFLNNDTVVHNGWLDHLVTLAEADESIAVVGAKLLYPDGRLQEAGSIVWRDGTGWNYGRHDNAADPRYNFVRDVDYVSGAAMLVRTDVFRNLGGFSERYVPAYYEDADLCFAARAAGYRVLYQPLSEVVHYESATSGDESSGAKRFQEINRPKFRERWAAVLESHLPNKHANVYAAARRPHKRERILVVDSYVPLHDREAGSLRLMHVVRMLREAGYAVAFLPDNYAPLQPYTTELQQMGVEVLHHVDGGATMDEALELIVPSLNVAWISRTDLYEKYAPVLGHNQAIELIYDTVDLSYVRKRREAELLGKDESEWQSLQESELEAARDADATVVVSNEERRELEGFGVRNVHVIPTIHDVAVHEDREFEESSGLLFIANYNHPPNVDAVLWLVNSVMPIVWQQMPGVVLTLAGSSPPDSITALRSENVRVTGYLPDVTSVFRESRVFVAPLRFGAGMKGKIGHALAYRLPIVTTAIGAEGFDLRDGENALLVEPEPEPMAAAILRLYRDKDLWASLSHAAPSAIAHLTPEAVSVRLRQLLESVTLDRTAP